MDYEEASLSKPQRTVNNPNNPALRQRTLYSGSDLGAYIFGVVLRVQTPEMNVLLLSKHKTVGKYDRLECKHPIEMGYRPRFF